MSKAGEKIIAGLNDAIAFAQGDESRATIVRGGGLVEWQPIDTAPKDGTIIDLTWLDNGRPQEIWPMQWAHIQRNGLFPGKVGMWTTPDGSITWNDDHPDGAPTHWRPHR